MNKVNTKILAVTVYQDRAMIIRSGSMKLSPGTQTLVFANLPDNLDPNSLQLSGIGGGMIKDVRQVIEQTRTEVHPQYNKWKGMLEDLQAQMKQVEMREQLLSGEKELIANISQQSTKPKEGESLTSGPLEWREMLAFYREEMTRIERDSLEVNKKKEPLLEEINRVQRELKKLASSDHKQQKNVHAVIDGGETEIEVVFKLSYIVYGAGWNPVYDFRVDTDSGQLVLGYQAMVQQNTGEDWKGVNLSLSTAKPNVKGNPPELKPRFLRKYIPKPVTPAPMVRSSKKMAKPQLSMNAPDAFGGAAMDKEEALDEPAATLTRKSAGISEQTSSVVFHIEGGTDLPSDMQPQQVMILQTELKAKLTYQVVPSRSQYAYLKAEIENESSFPLLAGSTNVFMDGHFIANSSLKLIPPGTEFTLFLGIDEGIKVDHKLMRTYRTSEGFLGPKKDKKTYEYLTTLVNHKKRPVLVEVKGQYPLSEDESIQVELSSPDYEEDTDYLSKDKQNILTWKMEIPSQEEWKIPLIYSVTFPKNMRVIGL